MQDKNIKDQFFEFYTDITIILCFDVNNENFD